MQSKEKLLEECVSYLRARPVFDRVLRQVREKAESLGHIGGKTIISIPVRGGTGPAGGIFPEKSSWKKTADGFRGASGAGIGRQPLCGSFLG